MTHWHNPYSEAISVTLEELASCDAALNTRCGFPDGSSRVLTLADLLDYYRSRGVRLDAYVLPQPSGRHCIGVRFGPRDEDYLSPRANQEAVRALLALYGYGR